ncbi:MAG: DUF1844 domain-containing protein [Fimbriimonadales bacterium]
MREEMETAQASIDIYDLLAYTLSLYITAGWQALGLIPDPVSGKTRMALDEAKIAIDCAEFLVGKLRPRLEPELLKEYERQLRDLKLNFVTKSSENRTEA